MTKSNINLHGHPSKKQPPGRNNETDESKAWKYIYNRYICPVKGPNKPSPLLKSTKVQSASRQTTSLTYTLSSVSTGTSPRGAARLPNRSRAQRLPRVHPQWLGQRASLVGHDAVRGANPAL